MNKKFSHFLKWSCLGLIVSIVLASTLAISLPSLRTQLAFPQQPIELDENYDVFDLGVVDANSDGNLDLFSVNHSGRQNFALGDGRGKFTNALTQWHLDQDYDIPNLEDSLEHPQFNNSGLYIYRQDKALYFHSNQLNLGESISGRLQLSWPVSIEKQENFQAEVIQQQSSEFTTSMVDFSTTRDGWLVIRSKEDIIEIPHHVEIDSPVPLEKIYLGLDSINPQEHQFDLMWRDRHSLAWTDLNRDGQLDVFIGRGGVKGQLDRVSNRIEDELMIQDRQRFSNQIEPTEIVKKGCPARQSAWVDFDRDDRLDLYIVCGRNDEPSHPNQLWQQQADGKFMDVATKLGLDFPEEGVFRWLDADNDGDPDLLVTKEKSIWLYLQQNNTFEGQKIVENFAAKILNLAIADFDLDGDLDAYAVSKYLEEPNLLLLNERGNYQAIKPSTVGLPETGVAASWVDYDNDGLTDFYLVPHGLYRQLPDHQFTKSQLLEQNSGWRNAVDARSVWLDFNNDGFRDLIRLTNQAPSLPTRIINRILPINFESNWTKLWQAQLLENKKSHNNWLELELSGSGGNPQAIGVKAIVTTPNGQQIQAVGDTENSYFSQGHYRLYFGLGKHQQANSIQIIWSDNQIQNIENLPANHLWSIEQNQKPQKLTQSRK